jgi:hypothetical protein
MRLATSAIAMIAYFHIGYRFMDPCSRPLPGERGTPISRL